MSCNDLMRIQQNVLSMAECGRSSLGMALVILATCSPVWACGGGGSTSYRKPLRPDHEHQSEARQPLPKGMKQTTASSPAQPQAADLSTP